tara:strand:+ start:8774 stop:10168 length:1395 start_codon:yes stop_codon:yes gene_type:complete
MAITSGQLKAQNLSASTTATGVSNTGVAPDQRRLFNFSDRIAELAPDESPFFVYLSKTAKLPTDDSLFRYLEDRTKINYTSREFFIDGNMNGSSAVTAGTDYTLTVESAKGSSDSTGRVDWLIKGMVFAVRTLGDSTGAAGYGNVIVRVESAPSHNAADTSFTGKVISVSSTASNMNKLLDEQRCQVIGTAYGEGTGSPDVFSDSLDDGFGYTQIFKTAAEISNTAYATQLRGHSNEFERVLAQKLREHKIDIERAMLFNQKARISDVQYTEGLIGHIIKNSTVVSDNSALSYTSGKAYFRTMAEAELTYDRLLTDFEVVFDPARGGSNERLALCSLPVMSYFNKMGSVSFSENSTNGTQYRLNMAELNGEFGHKLMQLNTIHGTVYMVKEPLFRGHSSGMMCLADMSKVYYRPLVGNGVNRDTQVQTNVQAADEDLRKDMILTEAGLEVCLPESHYLINLENV